MALPTSYMTGGYSKISLYFETILSAQAPEKFTVKFMKDLGFTSSLDTQFINILKMIGFLDDSGSPTERYFSFFDRSQSKKLVAAGVKEAYADLFMLNVNSQNLTKEELLGKFKTLTNGQKADSTLQQMVKTFMALCDYADWSVPISGASAPVTPEIVKEADVDIKAERPESKLDTHKGSKKFDLNYDIHIHLPATRDERVYDALFSSLAKYVDLK